MPSEGQGRSRRLIVMTAPLAHLRPAKLEGVGPGTVGKASPTLLVSDHALAAQEVLLLSEMVKGERLAAKLRDAAQNDRDLTLSIQERVDILAVLEDPPPALGSLRSHLLRQLKERDRRPWLSWPTAKG